MNEVFIRIGALLGEEKFLSLKNKKLSNNKIEDK